MNLDIRKFPVQAAVDAMLTSIALPAEAAMINLTDLELPDGRRALLQIKIETEYTELEWYEGPWAPKGGVSAVSCAEDGLITTMRGLSDDDRRRVEQLKSEIEELLIDNRPLGVIAFALVGADLAVDAQGTPR